MNARRLVTDGILVAVALVLSYVEALIPLPVPVPGIKIGLANIVTVYALYRAGAKDALGISLLRVLLSGLLFGNGMSVLYSLAGAALSFAGMAYLKHTEKFKTVTVSVSGGVLHNLGQILIAAFFFRSGGVLLYLPALLAGGVLSGILIGLLAGILIDRIPKKD